MDVIQPQRVPLALEPADASTTGDESGGGAAGHAELRMTTADKFLALAVEEYEAGQIDQTLWARASAQAGDDKNLVVAAYLRARATALQLQKRERRLERQARRARSRQESSDREVEPEPNSETVPTAALVVPLRGVRLKPKYVVAAAAVLASLVAAVGLIALPQKSASSGPLSVSAAPSAKGSAAARPAGPQPVAGSKSGGTSDADAVPTLEARVQELKDAGNWNVLVLYAAKWTRDEPYNVAAWKELSIGYANLRQFNDALVAATKAVELSPEEALLWRNIGHLNVTLEQLPEAESAFDRALALRADDADALCGAALVAQRQGRLKDADAITRRVNPGDDSCPRVKVAESVAVVAGRAAPTKPASPVRR